MIKKRQLIVIALSLFYMNINGQNSNLEWAVSMGRTGSDIGRSCTSDWAGNVYVVGSFQDTVDFDPGLGVSNLISNGGKDIFLQKLDVNGNLVWVKSVGGINDDEGLSIYIGQSGLILITGYFQATVDFDPGIGTTNLTSAGGEDIFVLKMDVSGNFQWAKSMGGASNDRGNAIAVDNWDTYYITGFFSGMADFDPGTGTTTLTSVAGLDAYVMQLTSGGSFFWARAMGGPGDSWGTSIVIDPWFLDNVYITGVFDLFIDFDTGSGINTIFSNGGLDVFVAKLSGATGLGFSQWEMSIGGLQDDLGNSITNAGNDLYVTGSYQDFADFNPLGGGPAFLFSVGGKDVFIQKLDESNGNLIWAKSVGGPLDDQGLSVFSESSSADIYLTGSFEGIADFDPSTGTTNLISNGAEDVFVQRLDPGGNFVWAKSMGGIGVDVGYSITNDVNVTGSFENTSDFDPNAGITNLTSNGTEDVFVLKLGLSIGVKEFDNRLDLFVYPNPAYSIITIERPKFTRVNEASFRLIDISGREVLSEFIRSTSTQLDVGWLAKGIYFYHYLDIEQKTSCSGKLVIR